jgi:hypothetical protein
VQAGAGNLDDADGLGASFRHGVSEGLRPPLPFGAFVAGTFLFGWVAGLVIVFKFWHVADAPRWMIFSGTGYVTFMLAPAIVGFVFTRAVGRLATRGWGGVSLGLLAIGAVGLVAGLLVL